MTVTPKHLRPPMTRADVVNGAVGPFDDYCDGYGNPGSSGTGYVSVLKLEPARWQGRWTRCSRASCPTTGPRRTTPTSVRST